MFGFAKKNTSDGLIRGIEILKREIDGRILNHKSTRAVFILKRKNAIEDRDHKQARKLQNKIDLESKHISLLEGQRDKIIRRIAKLKG